MPRADAAVAAPPGAIPVGVRPRRSGRGSRSIRDVKPALLAAVSSLAWTATAQELALPPRAATALTGSELLARIDGRSVAEREVLVWHEIATGNVPAFLRRMIPVTLTGSVGGRTRRAVLWVTPDYLGVGADHDWFRMPSTPAIAQPIADRLDCVLPTRRIVDAIWNAATVRLAPYPFDPGQYDILSPALFHRHHLQVESQRAGRPLGALVAGIKKDVVGSALVASWPDRVVIYGWHRLDGTPIQPLSKVHGIGYADYSHGVRLVARRIEVDGVATTVDAVLADPVLHPLLSDEGPIASQAYRVPAPPTTAPLHDAFPPSGPELPDWRAKFVQPTLVSVVPPPPSGDRVVLRIMDPAGGTDSLRLSCGAAREASVFADLLCEHRPELAHDGFERIGLFVRDRASGAFDGTRTQSGACYALTWDSHDGRVRCLRAVGGVLDDLLPSPLRVSGTAWRRFRIDARGDELTFVLDGTTLLHTSDPMFPDGEFGIGYHEFFTTDANMRGTRADRFFADVSNAFALAIETHPARLVLANRRGVPADGYFTALTLRPGAFPDGWFFGLDPLPADLIAMLASGHPAFVGRLGVDGGSSVTIPGLPPGIALQGVSVEFASGLRVWQIAPPVAGVTR